MHSLDRVHAVQLHHTLGCLPPRFWKHLPPWAHMLCGFRHCVSHAMCGCRTTAGTHRYAYRCC